MAKKNPSRRLTNQHKESKGAKGIFGDEAKYHDMDVSDLSVLAKELLEKDYPQLVFRYRKSVSKKEINEWIKFSNLYSNLFLDINLAFSLIRFPTL